MDEGAFLAHMATARGLDEEVATRHVIDWARTRLPVFNFKVAAKTSTFWPCLEHGGRTYWPIAFRTNGSVEAVMRWLAPLPPFEDEAVRRDFLDRINRIPGVALPVTDLAGHPRFPLATLTTDDGRAALFEALEWFITTASTAQPAHAKPKN